MGLFKKTADGRPSRRFHEPGETVSYAGIEPHGSAVLLLP